MSDVRCPHCGRPCLFPNVRAARQPAEKKELERRYRSARKDLRSRGCDLVADAFLRELGSSVAVIARPLGEVERLARSDREVYSTYYKQIEAEHRLPDEPRWDRARRLAEEALFPGYRDDIRFAALTLDERGLSSYGDCFFTLRSSMIAHRATVFEDNVVTFMEQRNATFGEMVEIPPGHRATWKDRSKLCVAKLGPRLDRGMMPPDFPAVLMGPGASTADDDFVEVHVFGPITIRTIDKIKPVKPATSRVDRAKRRAWGEKLREQYGVALEGA